MCRGGNLGADLHKGRGTEAFPRSCSKALLRCRGPGRGILVVLLRRLVLGLLLFLLRFGLLLVGFLPVFLRVLLCLGLRGIRPGMSDGRPAQCQTEKNKQDTSCDFFHKITLKPILAGFYTAQQQLSVASCQLLVGLWLCYRCQLTTDNWRLTTTFPALPPCESPPCSRSCRRRGRGPRADNQRTWACVRCTAPG